MRLKNMFRNSFFGLLSQFVLIFVGFFSQRVMNLTMGEALIGMNSVISNIIAILSVSELGISSAIIFHLYDALAKKDEQKIVSLMNLYRRAYYIFAAVITLMGLCVLPFVHLFFRENVFSLSYIRMIYVLWLVRTALSYLLSYKRSILIADQREYIVSIITLFINLLNYGSVIVILQLWRNYQLALFLNIIVEVVLNTWIIWYANRKYPYLKRNRQMPVEKKMMRTVFGDIKNIFISRLSAKFLLSTDNIIISSFTSVIMVGLYSNYSMITQSVFNFVLALSNAIQPSVGNLFTEKKQQKNYEALRQITFLFFVIAAFCAASLMSLMSIFVTDFWLAQRYCLDVGIVVCCVINIYLCIINLPMSMMMTASGMFDKERNISLLYGAVNLVFSLTLVQPFGVMGVLLGTSASYLVQIVFRTYIFFKNYLQRRSTTYTADLFQYSILVFLETFVTYHIVQFVYQDGGFFRFILAAVVCLIVPNAANILFFMKSWRLHSVAGMALELIGRR